VALTEIHGAWGEIKKAAIEDGKDIKESPVPDDKGEHKGHLHKALNLLQKIKKDVAREEDDPETKGLRNRIVGHINHAMEATKKAIWHAEHDGK